MDAVTRLASIKQIGIVHLDDVMDIQRNVIVREVLKKYGDI